MTNHVGVILLSVRAVESGDLMLTGIARTYTVEEILK